MKKKIIGSYTCTIKEQYKDSNNMVWDVTIKATKGGKASFHFEVTDSGTTTKSSSHLIEVTDTKKDEKTTDKKDTSEAATINTDILAESFVNEFNPKEDGANVISEPFINVIVPIVKLILTILQIIGAVIFVLSIAAAGLNGIIATADGVAEDLNLSIGNTINEYGAKLEGVAQPLNKKAIQKIIRRSVIGSIFLMLGTTIVKIVFNILSEL